MFHLKSNCLSFLFLTRSKRHKWAFYTHDGIEKHKTQYQKKTTDNTVHCIVFYPCDHVADWALWLPAAAQNHLMSLA